MNFHFPAPPQPFVPIADSTDVFPVRRIYCVGRNYEEHAREMGASGREAPFFFCKPADAVLCASAGPIAIPYPDRTADLQQDRKSTRLNSSHSQISYAVFCLKKKNKLAPHQHAH